MQIAIKEMDIVEHENLNEIVSACKLPKSISRPSSKKSRPSVEVRIPPQAKTKGSGKGGRPKLGGTKRWKTDIEKRGSKRRQCKFCKNYNVGHDSRNCPDKMLNNIVENEEESFEDIEDELSGSE